MSLICPICQDNLVNSDSVDNYVNKCGHVYHSACLLPWWDQARNSESTCPECRQPCNMDTITKLYFNVEPAEDGAASLKPAALASGMDAKSEAILRQIKEYIDVQTYSQTKDINDKFRQQNSDFSSLLLNSNQRMTSNYTDKLTSVSKELTEVISEEHSRLLSELGPRRAYNTSQSSASAPSTSAVNRHNVSDLSNTETFKSDPAGNDGYAILNYCRSRRSIDYVAAGIALLCLIAVIGYSHFILHAVQKAKFSDEAKTLNVSKGLQMLSQEVNVIAANVNQNQRETRERLDNVRELLRTGLNTKAVGEELRKLTSQMDKLLLEQIQSDRKVDYNSEYLKNELNMLRTQINADSKNLTQLKVHDNDYIRNLEAQNQDLQRKMQHLQKLVANSNNSTAAEIRREIENDRMLTPQSQRQGKNMWDKFTNYLGVESAAGDHSARIMYIFSVAFGAIFIQMRRY